MASFITGLKKSKKHQITKDVTGRQMGIIEDSAESVSAENIKEDNKQLQMKVDKNEKLIRQLHLEQTEHENVMKVKEQAKKRNMELLAEQKLLISTGKQLKHEAENRFGAEIKHAADRIEAIEKEIGDTRQESVVLENDTRRADEDAIVGERYFEIDKAMLKHLVKQANIELSTVTEKLDQLKTARGKRGRMYNSVEEFMAERAMIIDLAMSRGQAVQTKQKDNAEIKKAVDQLERTVADLQKKLNTLE